MNNLKAVLYEIHVLVRLNLYLVVNFYKEISNTA